MNDHKKKMVAPIIITVILVLYYLGFVVACVVIPEIPTIVKVIFGVIPVALAAVTINVLLKRIKEIRSGEEDDLSKY